MLTPSRFVHCCWLQAGAMVAMQDVDIRTEWGSMKGQGMFGSCLGPLLSSMTRTVGGMSVCQNVFTGGDSGHGWVSLAPNHPGWLSFLWQVAGAEVGCEGLFFEHRPDICGRALTSKYTWCRRYCCPPFELRVRYFHSAWVVSSASCPRFFVLLSRSIYELSS